MKSSLERSCKLVPKFSGPYLITAKLHGNKFKILSPSNHVSEVVHADQLKVRSSLQPVAAPSSSLSTDSPPVGTDPPSLSTDSLPVSTDPSLTDASSTQYRLKLRSASRQL